MFFYLKSRLNNFIEEYIHSEQTNSERDKIVEINDEDDFKDDELVP